ncbi:OmpP1/FadL family transporter [Stakelama tenebrarum]|uniref:Aromatic hydrocarbon degradation protein n=1 Tax=Stakelama tenebrarum TaxID=2711215 RepID=A0A6G6Y5B7_9SPHN|nr:outer membrane protein transport protein [Sphingosinithalassobacter tenebrarum]QIG80041.1 aromatic hydrocarbon degradation protein [Sphingosinithalassobacter tenebrarum]
MRFSKEFLLLAVASPLALAATAGAANAQAFYLQEQSAKGAGRAFSGEAADQGADSLWWNPAASAGLDRAEATASASAILPKGEVVDNGTVIVRPGQPPAPVGGVGYSTNPIENGLLPAGSVAVPLTDRLSVGLTVASPFSFTTDYNDDSWARYSADKTRLRTYDIQPSVAYAPTDWLRVGAALNIEYAEATLSNKLPNLSPALPDGQQTLEGDGWDFGWTVGAQLHGGPVTVGLSYKSAIEHTLDGSVTIDGLVGPLAGQNMQLDGVEAVYSTPWQAIGAIRFAASDKVTLNAQVIRYGWSEFDAIRLGAPLSSAIPERYEDSWSFAGGIDWQVDPSLTLRTGVQFAETPTQDTERDARVPDSDRLNIGAGASLQVSDSFSVDAAANYIMFEDAPIDRVTAAYAGTTAQTPILTDGELRDASAVVLTLGGRFRF